MRDPYSRFRVCAGRCVCVFGFVYVQSQVAESSKSFGGEVPASCSNHKRSLHLELFRRLTRHAFTPRVTVMAR
jgi:hypothetical protein